MLVCATQAHIRGQLYASRLGQAFEEGVGQGCRTGLNGAGSGGGHGGAGGESASFASVAGCAGGVGGFDDPVTPGFSGSGGGGEDGGAGGGVLHVRVAKELRFSESGSLFARGGDAADSSAGGEALAGGAGGGAGGTVVIRANSIVRYLLLYISTFVRHYYLCTLLLLVYVTTTFVRYYYFCTHSIVRYPTDDDWTGYIDASGGSGALGGAGASGSSSGGGGGGGIVRLGAEDGGEWTIPPPSQLARRLLAEGGGVGGSGRQRRGDLEVWAGAPGQPGNVSGPFCDLGREGPACQMCSPGNAKPIGGPSACVECAAGTAAGETGASNCTVCPPGAAAPHAGTPHCTLCGAGSFRGPTDPATACLPCPEDQISVHRGASNCTPCEVGTEPNTPARTACVACARGSYRGNSSIACVPCAPGSVANATGLSECSLCPPGHVTTDGIRCVACLPGSFQAAGSTICNECPHGSVTNLTGATSCTPCAAGSHPDSFLPHQLCATCPGGQYSNNVTRHECVPCPDGTFSAPGAAFCEQCKAGSYAAGGTTCRECPTGMFRAAGQTLLGCTRCKAGSVCNHTGCSSCTSCPAGHEANYHLTSCVQCPEGLFRRGDVTDVNDGCHPCPPGSVAPAKGAVACAQCDWRGGQSQPNWGQRVCQPCTEGDQAQKDGTCHSCTGSRPSHSRYVSQGACDWECLPPLVVLHGRLCSSYFDMLLATAPPLVRMSAPCLNALLAIAVAAVAAVALARKPTIRKASVSFLRMRPLLESLSEASSWETHKYKAQQHAYRLYLHGNNTTARPWRMPPLPPELRQLMNERE